MLDCSAYPPLQLFDGLSADEKAQLALVPFAPKQHLMREADKNARDLYLILEGMCVANRREHLFCAYKILPGEYVGLQEIIAPVRRERSTTITAKTPVSALHIPDTLLLSWQTQRPALYNTIIYQVLTKQFDVRSLLTNCMAKDSLAAGAYYLHYLYQAYLAACLGHAQDGSVRIWDTRQEIGATLGRDIRSVDRILSEFKTTRLIDIVKGKIYIDADQSRRLLAFYEARN